MNCPNCNSINVVEGECMFCGCKDPYYEPKKKKAYKVSRQQVLSKYGGLCGYCGQSITLETMQVNHIQPKVHGGSNEYDNLMPSCRSCNHYKRADSLEWYRSKMKSLHERVQASYIVKVAIKFGIVTIKPFDGTFYFERKEL